MESRRRRIRNLSRGLLTHRLMRSLLPASSTCTLLRPHAPAHPFLFRDHMLILRARDGFRRRRGIWKIQDKWIIPITMRYKTRGALIAVHLLFIHPSTHAISRHLQSLTLIARRDSVSSMSRTHAGPRPLGVPILGRVLKKKAERPIERLGKGPKATQFPSGHFLRGGLPR